MISIDNISYKIGDRVLFENLGITLLPGAYLQLRGHNGSGKTSLLRMICGIEMPESGSICILCGKKSLPIEMLPKPRACYIGHKLGLHDRLRASENITFWAQSSDCTQLVASAIKFFELEEIWHKKISTLSSGQKMRCALARLFVCPSHLWLLDEVDSCLDDYWMEKIKGLIATKINNAGIVIASSHRKPDLEAMQVLDIDEFAPAI